MNFEEIKRMAKSGEYEAKMTVFCGGDEIPERLQGWRKLIDAKSNRLIFQNAFGRNSELEIYRASLVSCDGEKLTVYNIGRRKMNDDENAVMKAWREIEASDDYRERAWADAMTDGSSTYWQKKRFFSDLGYGYLMGHDWQKGCKKDWNIDDDGECIMDMNVRGSVMNSYEIRKSEGQ